MFLLLLLLYSSGDLETEKVTVVSDLRHLSDANNKLRNEINDFKNRFDEIIEYANHNGIELPQELQQFVDCQHLL